MIEQLAVKIAEWGIVGALLILCVLFITFQTKQHQKERKEWRDQSKEQYNALAEISKETQQVMREHTSVLSEMKGILKTINKTL